MPIEDKELKTIDIPLEGKLVTNQDPALLGFNNFQALQNLDYGDVGGLIGIGGTSKINSTAITTYVRVKNLFHHVRETKLVSAASPADQSGVYRDSRILAYVTDADDANGRVLSITASATSNDVPNQKNFDAAAVFTNTDTTNNAGIMRFSEAPGNALAMCNGKDTLIWTGTEGRLSGFFCIDENNQTKVWDYTKFIQNTLSDTNNVATMQPSGNGATSGTILLLHLDTITGGTTFADSSGNSHDFTINGNATTDSDTPFESGPSVNSCILDGTGDYLNSADHADFDFSGLTSWSMDLQFKPNATGTLMYLYTQWLTATPAADYLRWYIDTSNKLNVRVATTAGGTIVSLTSLRTVTNGAWNHAAVGFEVIAGVNVWYLTLNGVIENFVTDADKPANYDSSIYIGADNAGANAFNGKIDEFRISNVVRGYDSLYIVPSAPYSSTQTVAMVCSPVKLKGAKWYIKNPNAAAATAQASYYKNGGFAQCATFVDNTSTGGVTLATSNKTITFDDTTDADLHIYHNILGYWYKFIFTGIDAGVTIYHCEGIANAQVITDMWDGIEVKAVGYYLYKNTTYNDYTVNVSESLYDSADSGTYAELEALATATDHQEFWFTERMQAIKLYFAGGKVNDTANSLARLYYWDGSAYVEVSYLDDQTMSNTISHARTGVLSWDPPAATSELKGKSPAGVPGYRYRLNVTQNLSGDATPNLWVYHVSGIPAAKDLSGYKFPLYWQNRLCLCSDQFEKRNSILISALNTYNVFNGHDSIELQFGGNKELVAASKLYTRFSDAIIESAVIFKRQGIFILDGTNPGDYKIYQLSESLGCNAPLSLQACDLSMVENIARNIIIWQGEEGFMAYDGSNIRNVSQDIKDLFDPLHTNYIAAANIPNTSSFYDPIRRRYHACLQKTTPEEWAYNILKDKWFEVKRTSTANRYLRCGCIARDSNGIPYLYGGDYAGYVMRLESGNSNDSAAIEYIFWTGEGRLSGALSIEDAVRFVKLWHKSKNTTSNTLTLSHYGDSATSALTPAPAAQAISDANKRLKINVWSLNHGDYILHSFKFTLSTSDEVHGFEPLALNILSKQMKMRTQ